jgi:hypothetical protein
VTDSAVNLIAIVAACFGGQFAGSRLRRRRAAQPKRP